jgi:hypothetical protein
MTERSVDHFIPKQEEGVSTNTENTIELPQQEAEHFFSVVKERLLNVNNWHEYTGETSASFCLLDKDGNSINRLASKGDYFQIDIPGPGSEVGDGKDFVQIEDIVEVNNNSEQSLIIKVRPSQNPKNNSEDTAHFFSESATSSFIVKKEENKITAGVYGRNEKPNFEASSTVDKIRNTIVATGAALGMSKIQWKSLVNGLLKK